MCLSIFAAFIQSARGFAVSVFLNPGNTLPVLRSPISSMASSQSGRVAAVFVFCVLITTQSPIPAISWIFFQSRLRMSLKRRPVRQEKSDARRSTSLSQGVWASRISSSWLRNSFMTSSHSMYSRKSLTFSVRSFSLYAFLSSARKVEKYPAAAFRDNFFFVCLSWLAFSRYSRNRLHRSRVISPKVHFPPVKMWKCL